MKANPQWDDSFLKVHFYFNAFVISYYCSQATVLNPALLGTLRLDESEIL